MEGAFVRAARIGSKSDHNFGGFSRFKFDIGGGEKAEGGFGRIQSKGRHKEWLAANIAKMEGLNMLDRIGCGDDAEINLLPVQLQLSFRQCRFLFRCRCRREAISTSCTSLAGMLIEGEGEGTAVLLLPPHQKIIGVLACWHGHCFGRYHDSSHSGM